MLIYLYIDEMHCLITIYSEKLDVTVFKKVKVFSPKEVFILSRYI